MAHPGIQSVVKRTASGTRKSGGRWALASAAPAFKHLLQQLPTDIGMAFILVQHLDTHRASLLVDILARQTEMPVLEASDSTRVEPDHVFVIPDLGVLRGQLQLRKPPAEEGRMRLPVDFMLCSLAREVGAAIGVAASGGGAPRQGPRRAGSVAHPFGAGGRDRCAQISVEHRIAGRRAVTAGV